MRVQYLREVSRGVLLALGNLWKWFERKEQDGFKHYASLCPFPCLILFLFHNGIGIILQWLRVRKMTC
jgi:uncharacterized membrane protein